MGKRVLILLLSIAAVSHAATILNDNFDSNPFSMLNTTPTGWSVVNGTVDIVANGGFGITCLGNTGSCIDLDGSTMDAGELSFNTAFTLNAGTTYTLTYWLSGSQRGDTNTVAVTFGGATNTHTLASDVAFTQFSIVVSPLLSLTNQKITFSNSGGDYFGLLLDNVQLDSVQLDAPGGRTVPEPSTAFLMLGSLGAIAAFKRLRTR